MPRDRSASSLNYPQWLAAVSLLHNIDHDHVGIVDSRDSDHVHVFDLGPIARMNRPPHRPSPQLTSPPLIFLGCHADLTVKGSRKARLRGELRIERYLCQWQLARSQLNHRRFHPHAADIAVR